MANCKRQGRGRLSGIDLLPDDIRIRINDALRDRQMTQVEILEEINAMLLERGKKPISSSAFNRYALNFEEWVAKMRHAREAANAIVSKVDKNTDLGLATTELVKTAVFDRVFNDQEDMDVDTINKLALALQRLEKASAENDKRIAESRNQVAADTQAPELKFNDPEELINGLWTALERKAAMMIHSPDSTDLRQIQAGLKIWQELRQEYADKDKEAGEKSKGFDADQVSLIEQLLEKF